MNVEITENTMFSSVSYSGNFSFIDNEKLKKEIYHIKNLDSFGKNVSNKGGWQSKNFSLEDFLEKKDSEIFSICTNLLKSVGEVYKLWNFHRKPEIDNFWMNVNKKNDYNLNHCHPNVIMSVVYYVQSNIDSGKIVFTRTDLQKHYFNLDDGTAKTFGTFYFEPKPGDFLIFPSYLEHFVEPNSSDEDRISMAFNFV